MKLKNKANKYFTGNKDPFNYPLNKHLDYLNGLPIPKNLIERSYFQYKCQCYQRPPFLNFRNNFIAFFSTFPILIYLFFKPKQRAKYSNDNQNDLAVFIFTGVDNIVPLSIKKKYSKYKEAEFGTNWFLTYNDFSLILKLYKYFHSPYFVIKCIYKMAMYRAVYETYKPQTIICTSEYSFTSSFLTWYCEQNQMQHINVMHGEKLLNIRDSFFQFHKCYVWDEHYISLFKTLRAKEDQFIVDTPPSLYIHSELNSYPKFELTYYLTGETIFELKRIKETLLKLPYKKICIRAHPRISDIVAVKEIFDNYTIENNSDISIEQSIKNTNIIASLYSTVLYQGFISGKQIMIDDISQPEKYNKLLKMKFIILSKPHVKISQKVII